MVSYQRVSSCCSALVETLLCQRKHDTLRQNISVSSPGESEEQKLVTCNRCGKLTYEGFGSCQYCGAPLSGKAGGGADPKMVPELPAWLESLRAGEQPVESSGEQFNYAIHAPEDKDALPSWMRPESAEHISADQRAVRRPASLPAPNTDGTIAASSLIDERSLPSWIRGGQSGTDLSDQRNIPAASLVQSDAIPQWMKSIQQPAQVLPGQPADPSLPPQGISASSLVDPQAVPSWLSDQSGPPPGENVAAGSLVDGNALPQWLREKAQGQPLTRAESNPPGRSGQAAGANESISAQSLIDVNALPDWLRSGTNPGQGQRQQAAPAARTFNIPPRVESVRVPSRPRSEMGSHEQSEAAANVFASMLGVASPAPAFSSSAPGVMTPPPSGGQAYSSQGQPQVGNVGKSAPMPASAAGPGAGYQAGNSVLGVQQPGAPQKSPEMAAKGQMEPNSRAPRRGFLETIRGWFSR
jgi:hypothetical protein